MRDIPFIDAHFHLWKLDNISYPWLSAPFSDDGPNGSVEAIAKDYLPSDYRTELEGWNFCGGIHVEAGADDKAALEETSWLQSLITAETLPYALVGFAALHTSDVDIMLEAHASAPAMRGIRHILNWHKDPKRTYMDKDFLEHPNWEKGYALLSKYGLGFDLQAYAGQFKKFYDIARKHPETPVSINHAGMPVPGEETLWRKEMAKLAELEHINVKISGFGLTNPSWNENSIRAYILDLIDVFGTERVMFASDVPTDRLFGSIDAYLEAYASIISGFSDDEKRNMWGRNANRIYRLGLSV